MLPLGRPSTTTPRKCVLHPVRDAVLREIRDLHLETTIGRQRRLTYAEALNHAVLNAKELVIPECYITDRYFQRPGTCRGRRYPPLKGNRGEFAALKGGATRSVGQQIHGKDIDLATWRVEDRFETLGRFPVLLKRDTVCAIFVGIPNAIAIAAKRTGQKVPDFGAAGRGGGADGE